MMPGKKIMEMEKKYIMNTYDRSSIVFDHGKGCYLYDAAGKEYIDLVSGIATCPLGHGNREFAEKIKEQAAKLTNVSNLYYSEQQALLAEKLSRISKLDKCFFSNSGAESVEAAIKLARKHTGKKGIIAAKNGFHGRTYGSLSATGKDKIKKDFAPLVPGFKHVRYNDLGAIKKAITKDTAAIIIEPIQGEAGVIVPADGYLKGIKELCGRNKILMIIDEVQTGLGRTGKFFAFEHEKAIPDIVVLAKGLANGIPIGATIASEKVALGFKPGDHGSTFGGNSISCRAANFTIGCIMKHKLMENASVQGKYLMEKLKELRKVSNVRGKGLMIGADVNGAKGLVKKCLGKGLVINSISENMLRFLPPLIIGKKEIDKAMLILKEALEDD